MKHLQSILLLLIITLFSCQPAEPGDDKPLNITPSSTHKFADTPGDRGPGGQYNCSGTYQNGSAWSIWYSPDTGSHYLQNFQGTTAIGVHVAGYYCKNIQQFTGDEYNEARIAFKEMLNTPGAKAKIEVEDVKSFKEYASYRTSMIWGKDLDNTKEIRFDINTNRVYIADASSTYDESQKAMDNIGTRGLDCASQCLAICGGDGTCTWLIWWSPATHTYVCLIICCHEGVCWEGS